MPKVGFSVSKDFYTLLVLLAKSRGVAPSQLIKELVESFLMHVLQQVNLLRLTSAQGLQVNQVIDNSRLTSEVNQVTDISKLTSQEHVSQGVDIDTVVSCSSMDRELARIVDERFKRLEKHLQDLLNAYTSKIDKLTRDFATLVERLESLEQAVQELRSRGPGEGGREPEKRQERKRTAMDILREQKAIFESDVAEKVRNRDAFFAKLQREGAIVVETGRERIAIEPSFWREFLAKIESLDTNDEEKIEKKLDQLELKLFKTLKESAVLVFDATKRKWIPLISSPPQTPKRE